MTQKTLGTAVPTASIAVNKSRLKVYNKKGEMPTYYLQKGQEFQIELFNPTTDNILAKIKLNGKIISQGGLVLRPGQRVFLERFLDVEKKFLFDTYEVANTAEVKEAIKSNGDFKVEFFREQQRRPILTLGNIGTTRLGGSFGGPDYNDYKSYNSGSIVSLGGSFTTTSFNATDNNAFLSSTNVSNTGGISLDGLDFNVTSSALNQMDRLKSQPISKGILRSSSAAPKLEKKSKTIETGRVEEGSKSDQKFTTVSKEFEYFAFHTLEYKMLPISQKVNTSEDINVKKYCTNCGAKLGKTDKFCSNCGTKA